MKIVALMNEKGGSGKSTLATNIATALCKRGKQVVLVDADEQGTSRDWHDASPSESQRLAVVGLDRAQALAPGLRALNADVVIVDTPSKAEAIAATVIRLADVALIVVQPSGADVWAAAATVKLINAKIDLGGRIHAAFVINRTNSSTKLTRSMKAGTWNGYGIGQMAATVGNRVAFAQALTDGLSVYDLADGQAKAEVNAVVDELEAAGWL